MTAAVVSFRTPVLPWAVAPEDEARFGRILQRVLLLCVLACAVLFWLPRPVEDRAQPPQLPPPLARLLLEREPPPPRPPPPVVRAAPPLAQPQAEIAAAPAVAPRPEPSRKPPVPEARDPQPDKPPGETFDNARRKAAGAGLLALKSELAELRGAPLAVQPDPDIKPGRGVGSGSGPGVGAGTEPGVPARALITSNAEGGSGGINTAGYSRDTGGGGLAGRATTVVEGVAGGGGGGGPGVGGGGKGDGSGTGASGKGGKLQRAGSGKASRSIEEIKLVFERNKGAIYALYNRALREEPSLQGKVVLELKIAPSGEVLECRIASSELRANELERKLLARIRAFDFGAKDVELMVVTWPVDFLPS